MNFIRGFIFALALLAGAAVAAVYAGLVPSNADTKPSALERSAANIALKAAIARDTKGLTSPIQPTDENLTAAAKLYGANCAVCHGASDGEASIIAKGFYVRSPQLARDGVEDDAVEISYWKIKHGIRYTAMPSFGETLTDEQVWQLAQFVAHMDKLPPNAQAAWKALPSEAAPGAPSAGSAESGPAESTEGGAVSGPSKSATVAPATPAPASAAPATAEPTDSPEPTDEP